MNKNKIYKPLCLYSGAFQANIWISYGVSKENHHKTIKKYMGLDEEFDARIGNHSLYIHDGDYVNWIWTQKKNPSVLAHECFHATHNILHRMGIELTNESQEIYAYFVGWLVREGLKGGKRYYGRY